MKGLRAVSAKNPSHVFVDRRLRSERSIEARVTISSLPAGGPIMKRNFAFVAVCSLMTICSSASACCLFPFFPTYSAGYPMFGLAPPVYPAANYYSAAYAPSYSYGGPSYYSGGCSTGCGTNYSASYGSYSTSGCCNECVSGCGTIGGCAGGNCMGSNCVGTEIRSRPEPDPQLDRDPRTFGNDDYDRDLIDNRRDDLYDDRNRRDDPPRRDPMDDDSFGRTRGDSNTRDSSDDWSPSSGFDDPLLNNDRGGSGTGFDDPLYRDGRKPPMDDGTMAPAADPMNDPIIDRSSRKPPMSAPVIEEEPTDSDDGRNPSDLLPSADDAEPKSTSIKEATSFVRLAGYSRQKERATSSQISSSRNKQRAPRWISLPAPAGRIRL